MTHYDQRAEGAVPQTISQSTHQALLTLIRQFQASPSNASLKEEISQRLQQLQPADSRSQEQLVYQLLQVPAADRSSQINARIDEWLHDLSYFARLSDQYGERVKQRLVSTINCQYFRQGKQIIRVGEESDRFYIVLRGEAVVLYVRDNKDVERDNYMFDREALRGMSKLQRIRTRCPQYFRGIPAELIQNFDQFFNSLGVALYDAENVLQQGQSFGQLGIIFRQKRLAHILCRTNCLIATVPAEQYMLLLAQRQQNAIQDTMRFLQRHFFSEIGKLELKEAQRYLYLFSTLDRKMHSQICHVHQPVNGFYIVLEGSVVLKREQAEAKGRPKSAGPLEFLKDTHKPKLEEYKTLLAGESFGLEELVLQEGSDLTFEYTACTASNSRLLFCPAPKLLKLMKNDKKLTLQLLERVRERYRLRSKQKSGRIRLSAVGGSDSVDRRRLPDKLFTPKYEVSRASKSRHTLRSKNISQFGLRRKKTTPKLQQTSLLNYVFQPKNSLTRAPSMTFEQQNQQKPPVDSSRLLAESLLRRLRQYRENEKNEPLYSEAVFQQRLKRTCRTAHPKLRN